MAAFALPQDLRIKHVTAIKPLLKPEDRRQRVFAAAGRLAQVQSDRAAPMPVPDIIHDLALADDSTKRSGSPRTYGNPETPVSQGGNPFRTVEAVARKGIKITSSSQAGGNR